MYLFQNSFPPIFICPQNHLIHTLTDIYLYYFLGIINNYYFSVLSYPKFTYVNLKSFQYFNKTSSKIDQAHCSNQIRIMTDPNSQSFQHLLHNKPAKVDHNLISFQTVFTLDEKILSTKFFQ